MRTQGFEEKMAHSPAKIAANASATQVVNSDELFILFPIAPFGSLGKVNLAERTLQSTDQLDHQVLCNREGCST
jgi:hypothetical protein